MKKLSLKRLILITLYEGEHEPTVSNLLQKPKGFTLLEIQRSVTKARQKEGFSWKLLQMMWRSPVTLLRLFRSIPTVSIMRNLLMLHSEGKILISTDDGFLTETDFEKFANVLRTRKHVSAISQAFVRNKYRCTLTDKKGVHSYKFSIGLKYGFQSHEYEKIASSPR